MASIRSRSRAGIASSICCACLIAYNAGPAAAQTFIGDTFDYEVLGQSLDNDSGTATVGPGPEFTITGGGAVYTVDIDDNSINITADLSGTGTVNQNWGGNGINRLGTLRITGLDYDTADIIDFIETSGTANNFTDDDVQFTSNSVLIGDTNQFNPFGFTDGDTLRVVAGTNIGADLQDDTVRAGIYYFRGGPLGNLLTSNNLLTFTTTEGASPDPVGGTGGSGIEFSSGISTVPGIGDIGVDVDLLPPDRIRVTTRNQSSNGTLPAFYGIITGLDRPIREIRQIDGPDGLIARTPTPNTVVVLVPGGQPINSGDTNYTFRVFFEDEAPEFSVLSLENDLVEIDMRFQSAPQLGNLLLPGSLTEALVAGPDIVFDGESYEVQTFPLPVIGTNTGIEAEFTGFSTSDLVSDIEIDFTDDTIKVESKSQFQDNGSISFPIELTISKIDAPIMGGVLTRDDPTGTTASAPDESTLFIASPNFEDGSGDIFVVALDYAPLLELDSFPQDASVDIGTTLVLQAVIDAEAPIAFTQWYDQDGVALVDGPQASGAVVSGATTDTLTIQGITAAEAGFIAFGAESAITVSDPGGGPDITPMVAADVLIAVRDPDGNAADFNKDNTVDVFDVTDLLNLIADFDVP